MNDVHDATNLEEAIVASRKLTIALMVINSPTFGARPAIVQQHAYGKCRAAAKELVRLSSPLFEKLVEEVAYAMDES